MNKFAFLLAAAGVLAPSVTAQQINVTLIGWAAVPASSTVYVPFSNTTPTGWVAGGCVAQVGTSLTPGGFVYANASFQGQNTGGVQAVGGSQAATSGTETYTRIPGSGAIGRVDTSITVEPSSSTFINRQGNGYRAAANSNVTVQWPGGGPIAATVQITALPGGAYPILATVPVTLTTVAFGQTTFSLTMNSSANTSGSVGNGLLQMAAICDALGTIVLQ